MKEIFNLPNRDKIPTRLIKVNGTENTYYLEQDGEYPIYITGDYYSPTAIDIPGGPFISVGYIVGDYMVTEIKHDEDKGYLFILKER